MRVSFHFFRNKAHRISMNECAKKSLAWQRRMKQFFYDSILTVKSCHMHTFIHFLSYHLSVPVRVECAWANVIPHANYTTCKNGTGFTFFALFFDSIDSQCEFILIVKCVCAFRLSQRTDRKIDATRMRWQGLFPCQIKQNETQKCAFKIYSNSSLGNIIYFLPGFGSFYGRSPFFLLLCYCLLM